MPNITPHLWFATQAEEAAKLYVSLFPNSKITSEARYNAEVAKVAGRPEGSIMTIGFELDGKPFMALNGGPLFKFTEAVSFMVECETQEEIDKYWNALIADGGEESQCGWLKDKFGLSWQITPTFMSQVMSSGNAAKAQAAMHAMMQMKKFNIQALRDAADKA